jgi:acyl-CoA thioesterase
MSEVPFADYVGIDVVSFGDGKAVVSVDLRRDLHNRRGVAHGGVIATMLDSAMAIASRTIAEGVTLGGTIGLNIQFTAPGTGKMIAEGRVQHSTPSLSFCYGEVRDDAGALLATATSTFRLRQPVAPEST